MGLTACPTRRRSAPISTTPKPSTYLSPPSKQHRSNEPQDDQHQHRNIAHRAVRSDPFHAAEGALEHVGSNSGAWATIAPVGATIAVMPLLVARST